MEVLALLSDWPTAAVQIEQTFKYLDIFGHLSQGTDPSNQGGHALQCYYERLESRSDVFHPMAAIQLQASQKQPLLDQLAW